MRPGDRSGLISCGSFCGWSTKRIVLAAGLLPQLHIFHLKHGRQNVSINTVLSCKISKESKSGSVDSERGAKVKTLVFGRLLERSSLTRCCTIPPRFNFELRHRR